ncbi:hypothetical protein TOC8172_37690 [Pseudomonas syringae]
MKIVRLSGRSQRATVPIPRWYKDSVFYKIKRKIEYCKAKTRAKVEHPFSRDQAPVWLRESALSWTDEKKRLS